MLGIFVIVVVQWMQQVLSVVMENIEWLVCVCGVDTPRRCFLFDQSHGIHEENKHRILAIFLEEKEGTFLLEA